MRIQIALLGDRKTKFQNLFLQTLAFAALFLCATLPNSATAQDITTGLVGHWKLDEDSGGVIADGAGFDHDGTWADGDDNDVTGESINGVIAGALEFDGIDDEITLSGFPAMATPFSFSVWMKPSAISTTTKSAFIIRGDDTNFYIKWDSDFGDPETLGFFSTTGSNVRASLGSVTPGQWHHIVGTYDGTTLRAYNNGVEVATSASNLIPRSSGYDSHIGKEFEGAIDDVRVYGRALTEDDIAMLYSYRPPLPPCNTDADGDGEPDYEAVMMYNNDEKVMQYCNGTEWISVGATPDGMPTGCSNIGQTCDDNTIYAGNSPDGDVPIYTTPADQSTGAYWGMMNFTTGLSSYKAGEQNTADAYVHVQNGDGDYNPDDGSTPNAFVICAELEAYGYDDWYLPALNELDVLYTYKDTGDLNGTFIDTGGSDSYYWSSTERNTGTSDYARGIRFNTDYMFYDDKSAVYNVRCVRKPVKSTSCTAPEAEPGTMYFNRAEGVLQYCNGESWINMGPKTAEGGAGDLNLSPSAPSSGLAGYWPLDSDATDAAGSNDGTIGGTPVWTSGVYGGALGVNGGNVNTTLSVDQSGATSYTYAGWVKTTTPCSSAWCSLLSLSGANSYDWTIGHDNTNTYYIFDGTGKRYTAPITYNEWQHIAATFDVSSNEWTFYLNGTNTNSDTALDTGANLLFFFGGNSTIFDDVRVYNRPLDEDEVLALYKSNSLAGHWKLDEKEGTDAADSSGNGNTGTVGGTDFDTSAATGRSGGALTFDGSDDYIDCGTDSSLDITNAITVSAWAYTDADNGGRIVSRHSADRGWMMTVNESSDSIEWRISTNGSNWNGGSTGADTFEINTWYHVAATYDGTNMRVYIDGIEETSGAFPVALSGPINVSSHNCEIGSDGFSTAMFSGQIDDVRIYNRALSADEIENLYFVTGGNDSIAISGCPNIGDECDDGSFYIGDSPADGQKVYMTSSAYEASGQWDSPSCPQCGDGNTARNNIDGRINVEALRAYDGEAGTTAGTLDGFTLVKYCDDLKDVHGHSDWYVPAGAGYSIAVTEQNLFWEMVQTVGIVDGIGDGGGYPLSSTEKQHNVIWCQRFSDGARGSCMKDSPRTVRCVRRGDKQLDTSFCSSPHGVGGQMFYNNDENIMQYCNGAEWVGITGTVPGTIPVPDTTDPVWTTAAGTVGTISPSSALSITVTATDNSGTVTYSKTGGDPWISVNSSTGELTGTAPATEATYSITVAATDSSGNAVAQSFDVVVVDCETGPIGAVCSDGAVYAGDTVGGARMYVADADESGTYAWGQWNPDLNGDNASLPPELLDDGLTNTNWLLANGTGNHDAAQVCRDKGAAWYLPARGELGTIYANRAQLGAANLPTGTDIYWSSSERDASYSWLRRLGDNGFWFYNGKHGTHLVRCVRR